MVHWRDTARPVRFMTVDARASFPFLLFLMHMRMWTLMFALTVILVFFLLERRGLSMPVALRRFRVLILGNHRPVHPKVKKHEFLDRGGS